MLVMGWSKWITRRRRGSAVGREALVDAVGVSALFHLMNRVANGTGTPLDAVMAGLAPSVTDQFGANEYLSSQDTPR